MKKWFIVALALLPLGCASPDTAFYTLSAQPGPIAANGPHTIKLRRTGLAGYLDRPEIVMDRSGERLHLASFAQWGEPLGDMIGRVLAEDLSQRLPSSTVFSEPSAIAAAPDVTVETEVQRLDADGNGNVTLVGQIAISRTQSNDDKRPARTQSIRLMIKAASKTPSDIARSMSVLLGQMADRVSMLLQTL